MPDSHELTRASRRDIPRLAELWTHAFPGERTLEQRIRQLEAGGIYGGIEDAWYCCRQDRLAGALRLYPLTQYLHDTSFRMMGVAAVAVAPDARRQGVASELCRQALRLGRARGDVVSALYPFRPDFYHRLGWALTGSLECFRFRPQALPAPATPTPVRLGEPAMRTGIAECYARVARNSHGMIERDERVWDQHLAGVDRHVFVRADQDRITGYVLVNYGLNRHPGERALLVRELVAETPAAYRDLLGWVALQADQWPLVRYDALPEEHFDLLLSEPRLPPFRAARTLWAPVAQRIRGPMLRVLNVPAALEGRRNWPAAPPPSFSFSLSVIDPELPDNQGPWRVAVEAGAATCAPTRAAGPPDLEIDVATFTQLFVGELSATAAVRLGLARSASASDVLASIDTLFRSDRTVRLLDEF